MLRAKVLRLRNFLEVGCGTGFVIRGISLAFPSTILEASEFYEDGLVYARERVSSCKFRQLDATTMSERDCYDCIGSFDVIEHIQHDELVLSNFCKALRKDGYLLLTVPQHPWLWSPADDFAHHVRRYTRSELISKVKSAGFHIEYCTSFVSLLLPLMVFQRYSSRNKPYNPNSEFKINPLLNFILYNVMQVERFCLQFGLRFTFGGSLLLLASKP
jgi:SAM-dependent methyltransferase